MQSMDRRLETMRVQNELSRINTEITLLQRQIHDMEAQDAEDDASIRATPRYQQREFRPRRVLPQDQVESEQVSHLKSRVYRFSLKHLYQDAVDFNRLLQLPRRWAWTELNQHLS